MNEIEKQFYETFRIEKKEYIQQVQALFKEDNE